MIPIRSYPPIQFTIVLSLIEPVWGPGHRQNVVNIRWRVLSQYGSISVSALSWTKNDIWCVRSVSRGHWQKSSSTIPMKQMGISGTSGSLKIFSKCWTAWMCVHGHSSSSRRDFDRWRNLIIFDVINWFDLEEWVNDSPDSVEPSRLVWSSDIFMLWKGMGDAVDVRLG